MYSLKDKNVLVVGLGRSGVAAAAFAAHRGARVTATDAKPASSLAEALHLLEGIDCRLCLGRHDPRIFERADIVVASPGVPLDIPGIARARARGIPVIGEMELALHEIDRPIIAVTGTNGKTTTTMLIGHLLSACSIPHCVGGNVGTPLVGLVGRARDARWVVIEVSSFQLETTPSLAARIAVWLNATPDHLDRHHSFGGYVEAKARLFAQLTNESWGIYNAADDVVHGAVRGFRTRMVPFDPAQVRADGGWYEDGDLWVDAGGLGRHRFSLERVSIEGRHNRENMLAAIIAVLLAGGNPDAVQEGLESFKGLPHRLEFVAELEGIRFYDDSKGTNVGASVRAIEQFAEPVILIAGGRDKDADFSALIPAIRGKVKSMVLIGEAADRIERVLGEDVRHLTARSMDEAVSAACREASPGDVVLLSPACASFDMFKDYADRGNAFKAAVMRLAGKRDTQEGGR